MSLLLKRSSERFFLSLFFIYAFSVLLLRESKLQSVMLRIFLIEK